MTTDLKALEEAIEFADEQDGAISFDDLPLFLEAARKFISIWRAVEAGTWKLVPVEPTESMKEALYRGFNYDSLQDIDQPINDPYMAWKFALQSAPEFTEHPLDPEFEKAFQENINDLLA